MYNHKLTLYRPCFGYAQYKLTLKSEAEAKEVPHSLHL